MKARTAWLALIPLLLLGAAWATARPKYDFRGHRGAVRDVEVHPSGELVATIGVEPMIRLWSLKTTRPAGTLEPAGTTFRGGAPVLAQRRIEDIAFSPDGTLLAEAASESGAGVIRLWTAAPESPTGFASAPRTLLSDADNLRAIAFSPDGKLLAANTREGGRSDHKIIFVDVQTGEESGKALRGDRLAATLLAFTPDGKTLVSAGARTIHVWDVASRSLRHTIRSHRKAIQSIAVAPDSEHFATADADDTINIWSVSTGKLVRDFKHKQEGVAGLAYSPSGRTLASGGADNTIKLWSPAHGKQRDRLWGHADTVNVLRFSPDGATLISGSRDRSVAVWAVSEPATDEAPADVKDDDDSDKDSD